MSGLAFDRRLTRMIAAVPAGEKLPLSRFGRELNCSVSVLTAAIEQLIGQAVIDRDTLRPSVPEGAAASDAADPGSARAKLTEGMSGRALSELLMAAAQARKVGISVMSVEAFGNVGRIYSLRDTKVVRPATIARARTWLNGEQGDPVGGRGQGAAAAEEGAERREGVEVPLAPPAPSGSHAPGERPTGLELFDEIATHCAANPAFSVRDFAAAMGRSLQSLTAIKSAAWPKPGTVEEVRAIIAGKDRPRSECHLPARKLIEEVNFQRGVVEAAHATRLPGETVAEAVAREAIAAGERRRKSFKPHPGSAMLIETPAERFRRLSREIESEEASEHSRSTEARRERELDEMVSPSSVLRRAQRDWPGQCEAVRAIASELGVTLGEAWRRVIGAGVDCMRESEA